MTQQYLREAELTLGDPSGKSLDVSALRFTFVIQHAVVARNKALYARVYNMAPQTVASAPGEGGTVTLAAGYKDNAGIIFQGNIQQTRHGRENPTDTYFDIFAAVGDEAREYATVNVSLAAGATAADVRAQMLKSFGTYGFADGAVPDLSTIALPRAQAFYGMTRDHMRVLARDNFCTVQFDDGGQLNMVSDTSTLPGTATVLTAATGMVGLPEQTENGIAIRCLLNPLLKLGGLVQINNDSIQRAQQPQGVNYGMGESRLPTVSDNAGGRDGYYKIISIDYVGDTRGQEWYCDLVCLSTDPKGFVPGSVAQSRGV